MSDPPTPTPERSTLRGWKKRLSNYLFNSNKSVRQQQIGSADPPQPKGPTEKHEDKKWELPELPFTSSNPQIFHHQPRRPSQIQAPDDILYSRDETDGKGRKIPLPAYQLLEVVTQRARQWTIGRRPENYITLLDETQAGDVSPHNAPFASVWTQADEGGQGKIYPCDVHGYGRMMVKMPYQKDTYIRESNASFLNDARFVVTASHFISHDDKYYLFYPYMRLGNLRLMLAPERPLIGAPASKEWEFQRSFKYAIACRIAHALSVIHQNRAAHCDVKPDNVLLDQTYYDARLADFGQYSFAKLVSPIPCGTTGYRAPELQEALDHAEVLKQRGEKIDSFPVEKQIQCDIYSFGVLLFELFFGELPSKVVVNDSYWYGATGLYTPVIKAVYEACTQKEPGKRPDMWRVADTFIIHGVYNEWLCAMCALNPYEQSCTCHKRSFKLCRSCYRFSKLHADSCTGKPELETPSASSPSSSASSASSSSSSSASSSSSTSSSSAPSASSSISESVAAMSQSAASSVSVSNRSATASPAEPTRLLVPTPSTETETKGIAKELEQERLEEALDRISQLNQEVANLQMQLAQFRIAFSTATQPREPIRKPTVQSDLDPEASFASDTSVSVMSMDNNSSK